MAEPKTKKLNIEDKLDMVEDKKELEILKDVAKNLPSAAKVRIHKIDEENDKRRFLTSIPATDFDSNNAHEFIKTKFFKKPGCGGGDYLIELISGDGQSVGNYTISLAYDENSKEPESLRHIETMNKALEMKEEAAEKIIEANTAMHQVEKAKVESTMELMGRQWDSMAKIYESRISDLSSKRESTTDPMMQMFFQRELENMKRDMEKDKDRFLSEIKSKDESKSGNDKVMDLLIAMIGNKKEENPIDTMAKTMDLVSSMSGGGGDTLDDIMSNPVKLKMYKDMLGIGEKKDFFEELMSNPMKAEMFKKILGVEEKKKDLITEVMENPERFKMIQRMLGMPTAEEVASRNSAPPIQPEPKKDFLEQMMDMTTKLAAAKPVLTNILGIESRPIANLMELAGNVISGAMPHIVDGVKTVSNNLVTAKLIEKGFIMSANGIPVPIEQYRRESSSQQIVPQKREPVAQPIAEQPKTIMEENGMSGTSIETKFEKMLATVIVEAGEGIEAQVLVDKVSDAMVNEFKTNPMIIIQIMKHGDKLDSMMAEIIKRLMNTDNEISLALAKEISRVTREKAGK